MHGLMQCTRLLSNDVNIGVLQPVLKPTLYTTYMLKSSNHSLVLFSCFLVFLRSSSEYPLLFLTTYSELNLYTSRFRRNNNKCHGLPNMIQA